MCRYAFKTYKSHFACFDCRKAFKKPPIEDYAKQNNLNDALSKIVNVYHSQNLRKRKENELGITYDEIEAKYLEDVSSCPQCGAKMAAMGLDFKAPKQKDIEAWTIISKLYNEGFAFKGCGCSVGYAPPSKLSQLPQWLNEHCIKSNGEKLLESISTKEK